MKIDRFYIRDGVPGLPVEKQKSMQIVAGYESVPTYADIYPARNRKKPLLLTDRARMLAGTSRSTGEIIGVAGIRCLAKDLSDLSQVLAACLARRASIYCLDTETLHDPVSMSVADSAALAADFSAASRIQQTVEGRKVARTARSKQAEAYRLPIIKKALPLWERPVEEITSSQIAKEVGSKVSSLNKWMGPRGKAFEEAEKRRNSL